MLEKSDILKQMGYELLSSGPITIRSQIRFVCVCGKEAKGQYQSVARRKNLCQCSGRNNGSSPRYLTQEEVEKIFKDKGCELLNAYHRKTQLIFKCTCGQTCQTTLKLFRKRKKTCSCSKFAATPREIFKSQNCELLGSPSNDRTHQLEFRCVCGNISKVSLKAFKQRITKGRICHCASVRKAAKNNKGLRQVIRTRRLTAMKRVTTEAALKKNVLALLQKNRLSLKNIVTRSGKVNDFSTKNPLLTIVCDQCSTEEQVYWRAILRRLKKGQICTVCAKLKKAKGVFLKIVDEQKLTLLTEFEGWQTPIDCICVCGSTQTMLPATIRARKTATCMNCKKRKPKRIKSASTSKRPRRPRRTLEDVKKLFADRGCELLSTEYFTVRGLLQYRCKCGEIATSNVADFAKRKYCCSKCRVVYTPPLNIFNLYHRDLQEVEILSDEVCKKLLVKAQSGDLDARNKLVESVVRWVWKITAEFQQTQAMSLPFEDLLAEANFITTDKMLQWEPARGKLITFVATVVKNALKEYKWRIGHKGILIPLRTTQILNRDEAAEVLGRSYNRRVELFNASRARNIARFSDISEEGFDPVQHKDTSNDR